YFGIPHGHAVGLTLGEFLVYNGMVDERSATDKRILHHFKITFARLLEVMGVSDSYCAALKINELMWKIGLETKLSKLGIKVEDLEIIVDNVNAERLSNNPRIVNKKVLHKILMNIL